jgi:Na+-transporting NADH:ubiquinone oxidoreductase subunit C
VTNDTPAKALLVVFSVALVCSVLVSISAVTLRPVQERNALVERSRNIIGLTGLVEAGEDLTNDEILDAVEQLDIRLIDINTGEFSDVVEVADFNPRTARNNPETSIEIAAGDDLANLGRRENLAVVYLVWSDGQLQRLILPVYGQGMWSTLYGYIALEADLNSIAAMTFYEQTETAGLGDQVQNQAWLAKWQGRKVYDASNEVRFRVAGSVVVAGSAAAQHQVDAMTGATVTGDGVTRLIQYWFGPNGYGPFIEQLRLQSPTQVVTGSEAS